MYKRSVLKAGGFCLFPFKTRAFQSNFVLKIYECAGSPPAVQLGYFERNRNETNNKNFCNKVEWPRPYKHTPISVCNEYIHKAKFYLSYIFSNAYISAVLEAI